MQHPSKHHPIKSLRLYQRCLRAAIMAAAACLAIVFCSIASSGAVGTETLTSSLSPAAPTLQMASADLAETPDWMPAARSHPLPQPLAQWTPAEDEGTYFNAIQPTDVGFLVWSQFPVTVYIEPPVVTHPSASARATAWLEAVEAAMQDWSTYLPLQITTAAATADITIRQAAPSLADWRDPNFRLRSAETRYRLYTRSDAGGLPVLIHRVQIDLRPGQTAVYTQAAARHELGHALGIWGHSPLETDALYFSQVRQPPPISDRDVNTLKHIYQQPTRLGWAVRGQVPD